MLPVFFLLGLAISPILAQDELFAGTCPFGRIPTVRNFNARQYEGDWYTIQQYQRKSSMGCSRANYKWSQIGTMDNNYMLGKFTVDLRELNLQNNGSNTNNEQTEIAETLLTYGQGQYFYPDSGWIYWVVDTDYKNYAVVWSCWDDDTIATNQHKQRLSVLARDKNYNAASAKSLQTTLNRFDKSKLKTIDQKDGRCETRSGSKTIRNVFCVTAIIFAVKMLYV